MATALPHAPPTKAAFPLAKVPAAQAPVKPGSIPAAHGALSMAKSKFHALLEKAAHPGKPADVAGPAPKAKAAKNLEPVAEKGKELKETKKGLPKDPKNATPDPVWVAGLAIPPKTDPAPKIPQPVQGAAAATLTERPKLPLKTDPKLATTANPAVSAARPSGPPQGPQAKTERTEEKPKVFVVDRRTEKEKDKLKLPGTEGAAQQPVNASVEVQNQNKAADPKVSADNVQVAFQTVGGKSREGFDLNPQTTPVPPRDAASFQQYLVDRGYGQLVDQARIVLKDQNAGEIRMTLYPESLGKVKVALNLTDSSLAGQIFVENQTVKDVFQSNMDGLLQAFRDGGWNDLSLQVSVGGGGGQPGGQGQPQHAPQARDYDRQVTQSVSEIRGEGGSTWNDRQVNLTA